MIRSLHLEVLRTARVSLLGGAVAEDGSPDDGTPGREGPAPREVWYLLHGYRQLARRFLPRFASIATPSRLLVAPEGLSRFYLDQAERPHGAEDPIGASWMTREDREVEIRDYIRYLDRVAREVEAAPPRRTLLGFSQGAHTASRWAVLGTVRPHRLILWGTGFPGDLPESASARLEGVEIVLVRGDTDHLRNRPEEEREVEWLEREGLTYRILTHPGGHRIDPELLQALATEG